MELLAKMGFPLDQCRQPWAFVGPGMRRRLRERMEDCTEEYGLENCSYTGFVRVTGYKSLLSASDMSYAVTALLECSAAAMGGGGNSNPGQNDSDELLSEEDREDRRQRGGRQPLQPVNGGNMTGTTGQGTGRRHPARDDAPTQHRVRGPKSRGQECHYEVGSFSVRVHQFLC
mmetsp:Transcript_10021/g.17564  ORF Transcript_10021/g.17564 Transcript_10021/m.17564 type:complete len:173 (-) Transcript_10021:288-806(-)